VPCPTIPTLGLLRIRSEEKLTVSSRDNIEDPSGVRRYSGEFLSPKAANPVLRGSD
jgi:hypothetical protein